MDMSRRQRWVLQMRTWPSQTLKNTDFQVVLLILWSLVKRLDSHAAVISQGQSHTPLSLLPPLRLCLHCSLVAPAAGGAVTLEPSACFCSYITRLSPILSSFVLPPSITHLYTSTLSYCSILRQPLRQSALMGWVGTSALCKLNHTWEKSILEKKTKKLCEI